MKNHFVTLCNYDRYASELILKTINVADVKLSGIMLPDADYFF